MGIDFIPTGIATGVSGSMCAVQVITAIAAGQAYVVPAGVYFFYAMGADCRQQVQDSLAAWNNIQALAIGGLVVSDGTNIRIVNNGGGSENVTSIKLG